jgi:hypothetical protein
MLEAQVAPDRADRLVAEFESAGGALPPPIVESFLMQDTGSDLWRLATVWGSRGALDGYRASVDTPAGVLMFRAADAEPLLTVFEVASHAAQP